MATAVIRSHDCLRNRFSSDAFPSPAAKPKRPPKTRPSPGNRDRTGDQVQDERRRGRMVVKSPGKSLVMEQVTILKRGEELKKMAEVEARSVLSPTVSPKSVLSTTVSPKSVLSPTVSPRSVLSPTVSPRSVLSPTVSPRSVLSPTVSPRSDDAVLCSTEPLGPDPEMMPKQIRLLDAKLPPAASGGCAARAPHAGYCAVESPSPSSLPNPTFLSRVLATKGLWCILHLDLP